MATFKNGECTTAGLGSISYDFFLSKDVPKEVIKHIDRGICYNFGGIIQFQYSKLTWTAGTGDKLVSQKTIKAFIDGYLWGMAAPGE